MNHLPALAIAAAAAVLSMPAAAQNTPAPAQRTAQERPAAKPAPARRVAKAAPTVRRAAPAAAAVAATAALAEAAQELSENQLAIAARVLTGRAECEFNQSIDVQPLDGKPGHFAVEFNKVRYTMVPEETTTGAVRLFDRQAGVTWLQIPVKSMLLNTRVGQRLVDSCTLQTQRTAADNPPPSNHLLAGGSKD